MFRITPKVSDAAMYAYATAGVLPDVGVNGAPCSLPSVRLETLPAYSRICAQCGNQFYKTDFTRGLPEHPVTLPCGHIFGSVCARRIVDSLPNCPACNLNLANTTAFNTMYYAIQLPRIPIPAADSRSSIMLGLVAGERQPQGTAGQTVSHRPGQAIIDDDATITCMSSEEGGATQPPMLATAWKTERASELNSIRNRMSLTVEDLEAASILHDMSNGSQTRLEWRG